MKYILIILSLALTSSWSHAAKITDKSNVAFEVVVTKVKSDVKMEAFIKADKEMSEKFVSKQKGFLKREVAVNKDGTQLFAIVHWDSMESAEAAAKAFEKDPSAMKRMSMGDVLLFNHFTQE